jgi:TPR repeat protein
MPSDDEIRQRLDAMPAEKRRQLAEALDQIALLDDLQSGKCKRAPEVTMKAIQGDPESIYMRSEMYQKGWCIAKDLDHFHSDLEQAATLGVASASSDIGIYLLRGDAGYKRNIPMARAWFEKGIAQGNQPRSLLMLGALLLSGDGGPKDGMRGVHLLEQAADARETDIQTSSRALAFLASGYIQGDLLPRNLSEGRKYALRGARQCDAASMNIAATSYALETPPDLVDAYAWANVATAHGDDATNADAVRIRSDAEKRMTTSAIAQAQTLSRTLAVCLPK